MTTLTAPALFPFALAALVMCGLVLVEGLSLLVGHSASALIDGWLDHDAGHIGHGLETAADSGNALSPAAWMSWLNVGRVPFLILLILALASFALIGFVAQSVAGAILSPLPAAVAALLAAAMTVPALRTSSRLIAKVIPKDESYVITSDELIGSTAEVTLGPLDAGLPGQVLAVDRYGNRHFLRARAADGAPPMALGERVLLVDRADAVFVAVPATPDL